MKLYGKNWRQFPTQNKMTDFVGWSKVAGSENSQFEDPGLADPQTYQFEATNVSEELAAKLPVYRMSAEKLAEWERFRNARYRDMNTEKVSSEVITE